MGNLACARGGDGLLLAVGSREALIIASCNSRKTIPPDPSGSSSEKRSSISSGPACTPSEPSASHSSALVTSPSAFLSNARNKSCDRRAGAAGERTVHSALPGRSGARARARAGGWLGVRAQSLVELLTMTRVWWSCSSAAKALGTCAGAVSRNARRSLCEIGANVDILGAPRAPTMRRHSQASPADAPEVRCSLDSAVERAGAGYMYIRN